MASKCSYRKQRGGESQAAMMGKIPQSITEQGMNFQRMTSTFHRSRKQKQNRNRNRQSRKQKQRGGALGFGPAVPASGDYSILSPQELKAAGLNPQFFDENLVNPAFGGAIVVPGGKLN